MGQLINKDLNRVGKTVIVTTIGAPVLIIKAYSGGLEKWFPGFTEALDRSGYGGLASGNAAVYTYVADSIIEAFSGTSVFLTADEKAAVESAALTIAEESGEDYNVVLTGLMNTALSVKEAAESK